MSSTKEDDEGGETAAASGEPPSLEMRGISKSFPGVKALVNVGLTASAGEIHALMGENGAGKSTLIKIMSGAYAADPGGEIRIDGAPVVIDSPAAAIAHGIAVIYQELSSAPTSPSGKMSTSGGRSGEGFSLIAGPPMPAAATSSKAWRRFLAD